MIPASEKYWLDLFREMIPASDEKYWLDLFTLLASFATLIGLPVALWAVFYAARQLRLARKAASAAAVIPLNDTFRECWVAYLNAKNGADQNFHFAECA